MVQDDKAVLFWTASAPDPRPDSSGMRAVIVTKCIILYGYMSMAMRGFHG